MLEASSVSAPVGRPLATVGVAELVNCSLYAVVLFSS
jgi:phosphoribosylcarboxyaminoimidazole (NCAIR) mutase